MAAHHSTIQDAWFAVVTLGIIVLMELGGHEILRSFRETDWLIKIWFVLLIIATSWIGFPLTSLMIAIFFMRYVYICGEPETQMKKYEMLRSSDKRFDPTKDLDLEIANGLFKADPLRILAGGVPIPRAPLLLFPPTSDQLTQVSSNSV